MLHVVTSVGGTTMEVSFQLNNTPDVRASAAVRLEVWHKESVHALLLTPTVRVVPVLERTTVEECDPEDVETLPLTVTSFGESATIRLPKPKAPSDPLFCVALLSLQPERSGAPERLTLRLFASCSVTWAEALRERARCSEAKTFTLVPTQGNLVHGFMSVRFTSVPLSKSVSWDKEAREDAEAGDAVAAVNDKILTWLDARKTKINAYRGSGNPSHRHVLGLPNPTMRATWGASGASLGDAGPPRASAGWYFAQVERELALRGKTWSLFEDANSPTDETVWREASVILAGAIARFCAARRYVPHHDEARDSVCVPGDCETSAWTSYHLWLGALRIESEDPRAARIASVAAWTGVPCVAFGSARPRSGVVALHSWCVIVPWPLFGRMAALPKLLGARDVQKLTHLDAAIGTSAVAAPLNPPAAKLAERLARRLGADGVVEHALVEGEIVHDYVTRLVTCAFDGEPTPLEGRAERRGHAARAFSLVPSRGGTYGVREAELGESTLRSFPRADPEAERRLLRFDRPVVEMELDEVPPAALVSRECKGRVVVSVWTPEALDAVRSFAKEGCRVVEVAHGAATVCAVEW